MIKYIRYTLWFIGLRQILPKQYIDRIIVKENHEKMMLIAQNPRLHYSKENISITPYARETVARKIHEVADSLPSGYALLLLESYRSLESQTQKWNERKTHVKKENPQASEVEIDRLTRLGVAFPSRSGPHQTGGAVDVSLLYEGKVVDMGTDWCEFNDLTPTAAKNLSPTYKSTRDILHKAMKQAGFVNYPGEWWHFSYGDRMWTAYSRKKECPYGQITL